MKKYQKQIIGSLLLLVLVIGVIRVAIKKFGWSLPSIGIGMPSVSPLWFIIGAALLSIVFLLLGGKWKTFGQSVLVVGTIIGVIWLVGRDHIDFDGMYKSLVSSASPFKPGHDEFDRKTVSAPPVGTGWTTPMSLTTMKNGRKFVFWFDTMPSGEAVYVRLDKHHVTLLSKIDVRLDNYRMIEFQSATDRELSIDQAYIAASSEEARDKRTVLTPKKK